MNQNKGHENSKSSFDSETVSNIKKQPKYFVTWYISESQTLWSSWCKLDPPGVKLLQGHDIHLSKNIVKCKSQHHHDKILNHLDEHGVVYRKVWEGSNIFHAIMIPQKLQTYILYESHNALGHNGSTRLYKYNKDSIIGRNCIKIASSK